jgi:hypothetical protein
VADSLWIAGLLWDLLAALLIPITVSLTDSLVNLGALLVGFAVLDN